jgi:hypothetical protein
MNHATTMALVARLAGDPEAYRRLADAAIGDVGPCVCNVSIVTGASSRYQSPLQLFLVMSTKDPGFKAALEEARQGSQEGGVPIGSALVSADGKILGQGHNMRIQKGSATLHVRTDFGLTGTDRSCFDLTP